MDPIMKLLEDDEDESMHSGADVEAFTAALNREVEGSGSAPAASSQPLDHCAGILPLESNSILNHSHGQWQGSVKNETGNQESQQQEQKHLQCRNEQSSRPEGVSEGADNKHLHSITQKECDQLKVKQEPGNNSQEPGNNSQQSVVGQQQPMQQMKSQQTPGTNQTNSATTVGKIPVVTFHMLIPILRRHLDKDRDMQIQSIFTKLRKNEVTKEHFLKVVRTIVGDKLLKQAQEGTCLYLELMCCKGGRPRYEPKFRKRASSTTNCPAKIRVKLWGDKLLHVELAILDHNHPVSPAMARFLNSYKQLSGPAKRRLRMGGPGAMPVEEPSKMPVDKLGALEDILFGESKHHNFVERGRLKLQPGDSEALRLFFTRMQAKNANFFNVIDLDDEGCVRNVFWADARSRAMYEYYNDAVTLDTSYVVGKYDMPLATFYGVNHHGQSVLLGCSLLSDETAETYSWLFKAWIACMSGNLPKAIITDHCKGIQSAIAEVIPAVRHRICLFQIMRKATERLGGLSDYRAISKALQKAAYDSLTVDEFEGDWSTLITYNGLQGNDWLRSLYECRFSWVPVFLKDTFWAGMSATQRNENTIPFFDGYVDLKTTLKQFLAKYEMALQSKYEKEAQADFETFHKQRPPVSKFYMEEQLSKVYTHNMFKKFQDEIEAIMYCHVSLINVDGPISTFDVKECIFLEDGKRTMSKNFAVTYNTEEKDITCICGGFQFNGILCRHSLSVLKFQQVREIPSQYVLDRWKKDFRQLHVMGRPSSDVVPNNRVDRYDYLSMRCLQLVDSAVLSDKHRLALRLVGEVEKFLLSSNTHDDTQPRIKSHIPKVNKPNTVTGQNLVNVATDSGNGGPKGPEASALVQASQVQKVGAEKGVVPAGYIGVPANVQQFIGNHAAIRPSIVYMVPSGVDPQAFGNGVLMPVMYQQMFQVPQQPNGIVQDTSANGKKKRPRAQKLTEASQQSNGTPGPASG